MDVSIPRTERRRADQRREARFQGRLERATLVFRRKRLLVRVVNFSSSGLMVETGIVPRIAEKVEVELEGFGRYLGTVRWIRRGRIGIDLGEGALDLA